MAAIPIEKFNINRFWEKTPTPLKYILVLTIIIAVSYFYFSKKMDQNHITEIEQMKNGINATYELINNFEEFRREQDSYNKEVLTNLKNLQTLVVELNENTNKKLDIILKSGIKNSDQIIEKIMILNESFQKISKIYESNIQSQSPPNLENNKVKITTTPTIIAYPSDEHGNIIGKPDTLKKLKK